MMNVKLFTRNLRKQAGASLLEILAYLGVASVVIAGAVSLLGSAMSGADTNKVISEVNGLRVGVRSLFAGQNNYGVGSLNTLLINAKAIPATLQTNAGAGTITNVWNGAVVITGSTQNFSVSYASVPQDACIKLASMSINSVQGITVNGAGLAMPVTAAAASGACGAATNTIVWTAN